MKLEIALLTVMTAALLVASDKPDFSGTWRLEGAGGDSQVVLTIEQNDTELKISTTGAKNETAVECNTMGKDCEATRDGDKVTVSYWYNGPMLVELVREGKNNDRVIETRRRLSEDGTKMLVEVMNVVPAGQEPEKLVFVRDQQVAGTHDRP